MSIIVRDSAGRVTDVSDDLKKTVKIGSRMSDSDAKELTTPKKKGAIKKNNSSSSSPSQENKPSSTSRYYINRDTGDVYDSQTQTLTTKDGSSSVVTATAVHNEIIKNPALSPISSGMHDHVASSYLSSSHQSHSSAPLSSSREAKPSSSEVASVNTQTGKTTQEVISRLNSMAVTAPRSSPTPQNLIRSSSAFGLNTYSNMQNEVAYKKQQQTQNLRRELLDQAQKKYLYQSSSKTEPTKLLSQFDALDSKNKNIEMNADSLRQRSSQLQEKSRKVDVYDSTAVKNFNSEVQRLNADINSFMHITQKQAIDVEEYRFFANIHNKNQELLQKDYEQQLKLSNLAKLPKLVPSDKPYRESKTKTAFTEFTSSFYEGFTFQPTAEDRIRGYHSTGSSAIGFTLGAVSGIASLVPSVSMGAGSYVGSQVLKRAPKAYFTTMSFLSKPTVKVASGGLLVLGLPKLYSSLSETYKTEGSEAVARKGLNVVRNVAVVGGFLKGFSEPLTTVLSSPQEVQVYQKTLVGTKKFEWTQPFKEKITINDYSISKTSQTPTNADVFGVKTQIPLDKAVGTIKGINYDARYLQSGKNVIKFVNTNFKGKPFRVVEISSPKTTKVAIFDTKGSKLFSSSYSSPKPVLTEFKTGSTSKQSSVYQTGKLTIQRDMISRQSTSQDLTLSEISYQKTHAISSKSLFSEIVTDSSGNLKSLTYDAQYPKGVSSKLSTKTIDLHYKINGDSITKTLRLPSKQITASDIYSSQEIYGKININSFKSPQPQGSAHIGSVFKNIGKKASISIQKPSSSKASVTQLNSFTAPSLFKIPSSSAPSITSLTPFIIFSSGTSAQNLTKNTLSKSKNALHSASYNYLPISSLSVVEPKIQSISQLKTLTKIEPKIQQEEAVKHDSLQIVSSKQKTLNKSKTITLPSLDMPSIQIPLLPVKPFVPLLSGGYPHNTKKIMPLYNVYKRTPRRRKLITKSKSKRWKKRNPWSDVASVLKLPKIRGLKL